LVGSLGGDYREYAFEASKRLVRSVQAMGVPVIYFGVETAGAAERDGFDGSGCDRLGLRQATDRNWGTKAWGERAVGPKRGFSWAQAKSSPLLFSF